MTYLSYWRRNDPAFYQSLVQQLRSAGYLGPRSSSIASVEDAWRTLLEDGATAYGNMPYAQADVLTYLSSVAAEGTDDSSSSGGGGYGGSAGPTASVDLTDPGTAKIILDQALTQYLGRKANEKEIARFTKALRAEQMDNPNTVTLSADGTTAIRDGGMNPAAFAEDYALRKEGAAEYQAATTFLDAFIGSLKAPVEVV
jgi:hypothetical protein